jgi:hypothetical protein
MASMNWNVALYGYLHLLVDANSKKVTLASDRMVAKTAPEMDGKGMFGPENVGRLVDTLLALEKQGYEIPTPWTPEDLRGRTDLVPVLKSTKYGSPYVCMVSPEAKAAPVKRVSVAVLSPDDIARLLGEPAKPAAKRKAK